MAFWPHDMQTYKWKQRLLKCGVCKCLCVVSGASEPGVRPVAVDVMIALLKSGGYVPQDRDRLRLQNTYTHD